MASLRLLRVLPWEYASSARLATTHPAGSRLAGISSQALTEPLEKMTLAKGSPLVRFGAVALLVVLDQWSKAAVYGSSEGLQRPLFGTAWLSFWNSCNGGAAFGQFSQFPTVLVIGRAAAVVFLSWLLLRAEANPRLVLCAMTLVLAGALGNLIDNLGRAAR